jgi:hypothetical protein
MSVKVDGVYIFCDGNHTVTGKRDDTLHNYNIPPQIYGTVVRDNVVRTCVDVLVFCGDNVLLGKRNILPWNGWWSFGGAMIPGENPLVSCSRILKKDIGLLIEPHKFRFIGSKSSVFARRREPPEKNGCHDFNLFHSVEIAQGVMIRLNHSEYGEVSWWRSNTIVLPRFHPTIVEMVKKVL